ncbi:MAG TPA: universal stress protein [Candidatus Acidoferrales bacterium]|nr:universal stress protein [Candidatus Acidoferrales bacterium]
MSKSGRASPTRRVLVALDASPQSLGALEAAAEFAARMQAELAGLFVEDVELLRLADSPQAREVLLPSATVVRLERAQMESKLRAHSERARTALASAANRARVPWSFRTARGHVASEILAAVAEADLLAMVTAGCSLGRHFRFGSAALELAENALPVLLLRARGTQPHGHLMVLYDGSPAARQRLSIAAELAGAATNRITVLIAEADQRKVEQMQGELEALLAGAGVEVRYRSFDPEDEAALLHALKAERAGVLVLPGREFFDKLRELEAFLGESETSLLLCGRIAPQEK